jgi:hypothetical protein
MRKVVEAAPFSIEREVRQRETARPSLVGIVCCALAFILCELTSIAPLNRLAGTSYFPGPLTELLTIVGTWLPIDLGLSSDARVSQMATHSILFLSLTALAFVIYALCAWWIRRQPAQGNNRRLLRWILLAVLITGLAFVFTPALPSRDAFVYAGYGRLISVYHANPYFLPLSAYPHDPFIALDDWRNAPAAYGPVWLVLCALVALFTGNQPLPSLFTYRLIGFAAYLCNILLIAAILRAMGRSHRTTALGMLLYAWNPLTLQESSLGGHNDTAMVTLLLLGVFLWLRAERSVRASSLSPRHYLPTILAFTLATLIKFTAAPLVVLFLVLLLRKTLYPASPHLPLRWRHALQTIALAALCSAFLAIALYLPFWIGHSPYAIVQSFLSPPSAHSAYGSVLAALLGWIALHGLPTQSWAALPLHLLSLHATWTIINVATLVITMSIGVIWLWRVPTTRTLILASLMTLGALLIVTPWFFPWYVVWIVGLVPLCLPIAHDRPGRALGVGALAFSASAFFVYLFFHNLPPVGGWIGFACLTTIGPPLLAFGLFLIFPRIPAPATSSEQ